MKMNGMMFFMASRNFERGLSTNFTLELQILQAICRQPNKRDTKKKKRGQKVKYHLVLIFKSFLKGTIVYFCPWKD